MSRKNYFKLMKIFLVIIMIGGLSVSYGADPPASQTYYGWDMPDGEKFIFLGSVDAKQKLAGNEKDGFLDNITNLDMELRMRKDLDPAEFDANKKKFKKFLKDNTRTWMVNEKNAVYSRLKKIYFAAKKNTPKFIPGKVYFIKTSGDEEMNNMYVRGECIVIPQNILDDMTEKRDPINGKKAGQGTQYICRRSDTKVSRQDYLTHQLASMIFHVMRANNKTLENRLYSLIGFYPVASIDVEGSFKGKIITDPTCWNNNFMAAVMDDRKKRTFIAPVCYSTASTYNRTYGKTLYNYKRQNLAEVTRGKKFGAYKVKYGKNGQPLITMASVYPNFYDEVRSNSQNLVHPATIMADNAALAVMLPIWEKKYKGFGSNLNHNLLEKVREVLTRGF